MLTDKYLRVMDAFDLSTGLASDAIDLMALGREIGTGRPLEAHVTINEDVASSSGGTVGLFQVVVASDEALSADVVVVGERGAALTELKAPTDAKPMQGRISIPFGEHPIVQALQDGDQPAIGWNMKHRYLGVTVAGDTGGDPDSGKLTVDIVTTPSHTTAKNYPSGFEVL